MNLTPCWKYLALPTLWRSSLTAGAFFAVLLPLSPVATAADKPPLVETVAPTLLGITGLSVNGRIQPHGLPASYRVEYGPTTAYGSQTESKPLPPRLAAHYHETWNEGWNGWRSWDAKLLHFKDGGAERGHIRYESIKNDDHNHDDGVGTVHLAKYMYPGRFSPIPAANLGGGDPDLRDALVKVAVRGVDWKPNGTELMWWSQSQSNIEINPTDATLGAGYKHPNWSYTGHDLTDLLMTGKWERAEYRLNNNTHFWSYCGNNAGVSRYDAYWSIDQVQRHLNIDLFHMVMFVDPQNRPTGAIDFDEFEVAYRNYSLAYPSNGGKLTASPTGSDDQASALTDGWRHGPKRMWSSAAKPTAPLEFTYEFAKPVTIDTIQIHQHPEWPAKEVEVLVSEDGQSWKPLAKGIVPDSVPTGPNFAYLIQRGLKGPARQAKVRILSGYKPEHWGLGEIEFFGTGAEFATDDDWYNVNLDLLNLKAGETMHYRVVATSIAGTTPGNDVEFTLPKDAKPWVVTGPASRIAAGSARLSGRLSPLGTKTNFHFEYGKTTAYGQKTKPTYGGLQITPRHGFAMVTGLEPGLYHYRLVAVNPVGTAVGEDATFTAK